ncbi:hypothetical protein BN3661_01073 [Eubacteriaceae bacterium CHKCI005]|nr:hypothetical protein BN3661_01073 [Eubacteriaceae bacterium CHKCI005]
MDHNDNVNSLIEQYKRDLMRYRQRSRTADETVPASAQPVSAPSTQTNASAPADPRPENSPSDWEQEAVPVKSPPPKEIPVPSVRDTLPQEMDPAPPEPAADFPPPVVTDPKEQTGIGYLRVEAKTARQALPVEGAYVVVRQVGEGEEVPLERIMYTDSEGKTPKIPLPTVPASLSMAPGTDHPYTEYIIQVDKPGYISVRDFNVPIYDGIVAIQPVELSPLPEGDRDGAIQDIYESAPTGL